MISFNGRFEAALPTREPHFKGGGNAQRGTCQLVRGSKPGLDHLGKGKSRLKKSGL